MVTKWGLVPVPENKIDITASGVLVGYQWDAWGYVLSAIWMSSGGWKDPIWWEYYSYMVNTGLNKYQILWYLEDGSQVAYNLVGDTYAATDYSSRFKKTLWERLWILTQSTTEIPVHRMLWTGSLDVKTTTWTYVTMFEDNKSASWTWAKISMIASALARWGILWDNCKWILDANKWFKNQDGTYLINPSAPFEVYCDMTTDWGGWTLFECMPEI